ncbi:MAG TPA: DUF2840 domain-containing protein [Acetobacteraceae bacterium]|nr:DUF2840 domain-containing protein [Acetobacteraceae bacterium]
MRFGHDVAGAIVDHRRHLLSVAPDATFAFVRRASNGYSTIQSRIDIASLWYSRPVARFAAAFFAWGFASYGQAIHLAELHRARMARELDRRCVGLGAERGERRRICCRPAR